MRLVPKIPIPTQESMAATLGSMIRANINPAELLKIVANGAGGKALVAHAALQTPLSLLAPFKADPKSWKHLEGIDQAKLTEFAAGFIEAAKKG